MAFSGTYDFALDILELTEEAYQRCGLEVRAGDQLRSARRSLDLLLTSWANEQVNLWTLDQASLDLVDGTASYTISSPALDILDAVVNDTDNYDSPMTRISIEEYLKRPDKTSEGRPTHYAVERNTNTLTLYLYPVPDDSTLDFLYWRIRYIQDAGVYSNNAEVPRRFLPALTSGLAWYVANKNPAKLVHDPAGNIVEVDGVGFQRRQELLQQYGMDLEKAKDEDRDRSSMYILPDRVRI